MSGGGLLDTGKSAWDKAIANARELGKLAGMTLEVGILEGKGADEKHEGGDLTVLGIATVQEFGAQITVPEHETEIFRKIAADGQFMNNARFVKAKKSNYATKHHVDAYEITIPARSFIRDTIDEQLKEIMAFGQALLKKVAEGNLKAGQMMRLWGEDVIARIRTRISEGIAPPLAASTIAGRVGGGKGSGGDTPLFNTGHMMRSVTYRVLGAA